MKEVARINDQLKRAYEGEAWHGPSLKELLADVTADQAVMRPLGRTHNIWEILLHISAWKRVIRRRLEGESVELPTEGDWPPVPDTSNAAWNEALATLENGHKELLDAVARLSDSRLDDIVVGRSYSVYFMLHGLIQHDLYHAGQISLLKKEIGKK